jgi:lipopolysaccharide export system protein LptC
MRVAGLGVLLLVLAIWSVWWVSSDAPAPISSPQTSVVDYYLHDVRLTALGADGRPTQSLQVAAIHHFAGDVGTQLSQPELSLYPATGPPWRMVADSGWLDAAGEVLDLSGAVQLSRATAVPFQLQTAALQAQLSRRYLETVHPVQIQRGWQQLQATGMQAWLQAPVKIEFLHDVTGRYVPETH